MALSERAEMRGLGVERNKQSSSSNSSCSPAREGSMIPILSITWGAVAQGLVLEKVLCKAGCGHPSGGWQGRLRHAFDTGLALHQVCAGFSPNVPSPKLGDKSGARGAFKGVAKGPRSPAGPCPPGGAGSGAVPLPPSRCTQRSEKGGGNCLFVYFTL